MCGLYRYGGSRTRVPLAGTGLRPTRRACPRRCGAWLSTGRCSVRDGGAAFAVASVPRPGPTPGCCMQDDEDGVGSVAAPLARSREAEPCPRDGAGLRCPPDLDPPYVFWPEVPHVNGVLPCGSLHRAVRPSVGGFLCNGTLCGGACPATPLRGGGHAVPHNGPPSGARPFCTREWSGRCP